MEQPRKEADSHFSDTDKYYKNKLFGGVVWISRTARVWETRHSGAVSGLGVASDEMTGHTPMVGKTHVTADSDL